MVAEMVAEIHARKVKEPSDVIRYIEKYRTERQEHFFVLSLDGAHHVIDVHTISVGLVNRTIIHPREVFRAAIVDNAVAIIIGHNHPSGSLDLSDDDTEVIKRLVECGELIGIRVLDHILISSLGEKSAIETGEMP